MNFTLRQAHKLVEKINAKIASIDMSVTADVSPWTVTDATLADLQIEFTNKVNRLNQLNNARHTIRREIGLANQVEVAQLIATRKYLIDQASVLRNVVNHYIPAAVSTSSALMQKVAAQKTAATTSSVGRFDSDTVMVSLVTPEDVKKYADRVDALQLEIEEVEDALTLANASRMVQITIPADVLVVLREESLIK